WQDFDGGKLDKFVWLEETIGTGSNGKPLASQPPGFPMEGAISMGFYNMNTFYDADGNKQPAHPPISQSLTHQSPIHATYHQAIMGGTVANFQALVSGDVAFLTDPMNLNGKATVPYPNQIENPNPVQGTNNYYLQDGYSGGSYVSCADPNQPGVASINQQLS